MISAYQSLHIFEHVLFILTESLWVVAPLARPYAGRSPGRMKPNANLPVTETLVSLRGLMLHCLRVLAQRMLGQYSTSLIMKGKQLKISACEI